MPLLEETIIMLIYSLASLVIGFWFASIQLRASTETKKEKVGIKIFLSAFSWLFGGILLMLWKTQNWPDLFLPLVHLVLLQLFWPFCKKILKT